MATKHSVTTTTSSSTREEVRIVGFDLNYVKTLPGILKCLELILGFLALICIISNKIYGGLPRKTYFIVISSGGLIITGILLIFYIFHVIQRLITIPWLMVELVFCFIWSLLYLIASSLVIDLGKFSHSFTAAGFFGFCATIAYFFDAVTKFRSVRVTRQSAI